MSITAVWGPPNSGKTTLAIDLAFALSRSGKTVCLISPEPFSELPYIFGVKLMNPQSIEAAYHTPGNLKQVVFQLDNLLFILAEHYFANVFDEPESLSEVKNVLAEADAEFDCVIVDCPSSADNTMAAWAMNQADSILLLTGCRSSSIAWYQAYSRAIGAVAMKTIHVCVQCNDSYDYRGLNNMIKVTPKVWVPFYPDAEAVQRQRRTLYDSPGRSGKAYTAAVDEIGAEILYKEADHEYHTT